MIEDLGDKYICDYCAKEIVSKEWPVGWWSVWLSSYGHELFIRPEKEWNAEHMQVCKECFPAQWTKENRVKRVGVFQKLFSKLKGSL